MAQRQLLAMKFTAKAGFLPVIGCLTSMEYLIYILECMENGEQVQRGTLINILEPSGCMNQNLP